MANGWIKNWMDGWLRTMIPNGKFGVKCAILIRILESMKNLIYAVNNFGFARKYFLSDKHAER